MNMGNPYNCPYRDTLQEHNVSLHTDEATPLTHTHKFGLMLNSDEPYNKHDNEINEE